MMNDKSKLMAKVRSVWEVEIGADSAYDTAIDSDVIAAFKNVLATGVPVTDEAILKAIHETGAWRSRQRFLAEDVFKMVKDRDPTESELDALAGFTTVSEITDALTNLPVTGPDTDALSDVRVDPAVNPEDPASNPEEGDRPPVSDIDELWIDEFAKVFERDPFVHEYHHLRNEGYADLVEVRDTYLTKKQDMEQVYYNYLNQRLTESRFVRMYVPDLFTNDVLVEETIVKITDSQDYTDAMKARLSQIHTALFSQDLDEEDAGYLFATRVRAERLSLTCDLNEVVIRFRDETDAHYTDMRAVWTSTLGREPFEIELRRYRSAYREDKDAARARLRSDLVHTIEFTNVVKEKVAELYPQMPVHEVYDIVKRVLDDHDLAEEDLAEAIASAVLCDQ